MTLLEAIKSNRPFKRPEWNYYVRNHMLFFTAFSGDGRTWQFVVFSPVDIMATDYIIREANEQPIATPSVVSNVVIFNPKAKRRRDNDTRI